MYTARIAKNIIFILVCTGGLFLCAAVGSAQAYFSDDNNVADTGSFQVGSVAATLTADPTAVDIEADAASTITLTTADTSTLATQSRLTFTPQSCRADFYNELLLEVTTASGTTASSFASSSIVEMDVPNAYTLDVAPSSDFVALANEDCVITATMETWQASFADASNGFSSIDTTTFTLTTAEPIGPQETSSVVLNELYPAVLSTTTEPLEREWVELYNGTDSAVDVAGWRIDEYIGGTVASGSRPHTIVSSCTGVTASDHMQPFGTTDTVIPAGGFLVLEFCGTASYMLDGGDTIELYNAAAAQVDTHTYPATANGKSHARIPDGAAWVDPVPTPGNKNNATRADLEAEGWDEESIERTLAVLAAEKEIQTESATTQSASAPIQTTLSSSTSTSTASGTTQSARSGTGQHSTSSVETQASSTASTTRSVTSTSSTTSTTTERIPPTASTSATSSLTMTASNTLRASSSPVSDDPTPKLPPQPAATTTKSTISYESTSPGEVSEHEDPPDETAPEGESDAKADSDAGSTKDDNVDSDTETTTPTETESDSGPEEVANESTN